MATQRSQVWEYFDQMGEKIVQCTLFNAKILCYTGNLRASGVFSTAGLIVNRLRTRLSPEHVDMLISLNK